MSSDAPVYNPPAPPDPAMVAAAQGRQERQTSRANNLYMNPTVRSPFGNVRYSNNEETIDGDTIQRPEQTIELGPHEQQAYERGHQIRNLIGSHAEPLGRHLMQGIQGLENIPHERPNFEGVDRIGPIDPNERHRFEEAYFNRGSELLNPQYERQEQRLRSRLNALGHPIGNEAYHNEMNQFQQNRNQALQQLANESILQGGQEQRGMYGLGAAQRAEQLQQATRPYEYNQMERRNRMGENQFNLSALHSLLTGQQPQLPQLQQFNTAAMRAPDIQGLYSNNYAQQAQNYNTGYQNEMANHMAHLQGLYGLAGAGMGAAGNYFGRTHAAGR